MHGRMHGAVLGAGAAVGMKNGSGESVFGHDGCGGEKMKISKEKMSKEIQRCGQQPDFYIVLRWRTVSYRHTALATLTLRLSTEPSIGIATRSSQVSRVRRRIPSPSRSEEHTSELQSLMRISYAVFCLKKKKHH